MKTINDILTQGLEAKGVDLKTEFNIDIAGTDFTGDLMPSGTIGPVSRVENASIAIDWILKNFEKVAQ